MERDHLGRTRSEARKDYLGFTRDRPTFERGRDRWNDFAIRFQGSMRDHGVTEEQAKWVLYNAIVGQSSRLVISSMNPELMAIQHMEFREYLRRMGEKFTPCRREHPDGGGVPQQEAGQERGRPELYQRQV